MMPHFPVKSAKREGFAGPSTSARSAGPLGRSLGVGLLGRSLGLGPLGLSLGLGLSLRSKRGVA